MKNLTIGKRLSLATGGMVCLLLLLGLLSWVKFGQIRSGVTHLDLVQVPELTVADTIRYELVLLRTINLKHAVYKEAERKDPLDKEALQLEAELGTRISEFDKKIHTDEQRKLFSAVPAMYAAYLVEARKLREASKNNQEAEVYAALLSAGKIGNDLVKAVQGTMESSTRDTVEDLHLLAQSSLSARNFILITIGCGTLLGIVGGILITRSITSVLQHAISELGSGAAQTTAASGQVAASSQALAEGASEQAASLEETGASLEEISSMTRRNAENAQKTKDLAKTARKAADTGCAEMQQMTDSMKAIQASSDEIGKIIKTIDELAFQTNILALNAAVEAARAGEAGMGFAVVADEVRNLAQRSAHAAKETENKIQAALAATAQGVKVSVNVARSLNEIVQSVRTVDDLIGEIATASGEQSAGLAQINIAISEMDKVTQSNAASAEEGASAAQELNSQSLGLRGIVADLARLAGQSENTAISKEGKPVWSPTRFVGHAKSPERSAIVEPKDSRPVVLEHDFVRS